MNCSVRESELKGILLNALKEDIGKKDITTETFIPRGKTVKAIILAKESCVVCGLKVAEFVFKLKDKQIKFEPLVREGKFVKRREILARIYGKARSILTAERVALNFLSLLCGVSTRTRSFIDAVKPFEVKLMDTRKTIPGLRVLEKYAVRVGGGFNHRFSLEEMTLLKDNHLKIIGGLSKIEHSSPVEIEVRKLAEFKQAIKLRPKIIMLDNMNMKDIRAAVRIRNSLFSKSSQHSPKLEASGGINIKNAKKIASTGVDMISIGALTHSVNSVDISLEIL